MSRICDSCKIDGRCPALGQAKPSAEMKDMPRLEMCELLYEEKEQKENEN